MINIGPTIEWKTFIYEGNKTHYRVSNNGDVENILTGKRIKPYINKKGYLKIEIGLGAGKKSGPNRMDGKRPYRKILSVHTMVALMFVDNPNPETHTTVNHINYDKLDNWYENLEWLTNRDNIRDSYTSGIRDYTRTTALNRNRYSKYTVRQAHEICKLWVAGYTRKDIGKELNLPNTFIKDVLGGRTRQYVSSQYGIVPKNDRRKDTVYTGMYLISETGKIKLDRT